MLSRRIFGITIALFGFLLAVVATSAAQSKDDPIISTVSGQVRGIHLQDGGANFLGIPYAQPPVGNLRWHEPVPPKTWNGIRDAKDFGAPCAQSVYGDWNRRNAEASQ